ncbi:Putative KHG/KDPG aldolase [Acaryochloris thomasi RCC1774]|uniref:KHG/KDPG aldolase n=1 Tax=Acaryochloris thomasi RCC1774 TaxID=1764569 RepID=A0A2W1JJE6_9CYAN|nr:bifunctional 4-hydroxy-2-oxoglutarate aldolase/2-dehydro-3-deoxy-phosphogluconate aldolase [Acaryochloris thomasi]PZD70384.1 Putative KHG/KDPG aldolase [Acaryochloris thomasi RCC1774]
MAWLDLVQQQRAFAVIRAPELSLGLQMARAVAASGLELIEIAWNSDQAPVLIETLRKELPHCQIGVGTIMDRAGLRDAIASGIQFCFSPHTNPDLIAMARSHNIPMISGALTPTEIVTAWQAGATCVKVFPVQSVGGCNYIHSIQGPLGQIPLIPTGGVTLENAMGFIEAGAIAVGLSSSLFPQLSIQNQDWDDITQRCTMLKIRLQHCENSP